MAGTITSLEFQKKNKSRVNVSLDGAFAFGININDALSLKKGQYLTDEQIAQLREEDDLHRAYDRALHFLGFRARSKVEMERYLREKEFTPAVIAGIITRLIDEKYLDDRAFALAWVESRQMHKPKSKRALSYELREKGVERAIIDDVLDGVDEDIAAEEAIIRQGKAVAKYG
jgi:regulatory protein